LHLDLDSDPKHSLSHMWIVDNKNNKLADMDSNRMMRMRIPKNDNRILRMRILLITASAFTFSPLHICT
jgi:hypothetical protein